MPAGRPPNPDALRHIGIRLSPVSPKTAQLVRAIAQSRGITQAAAIELGLKAIATPEEIQLANED